MERRIFLPVIEPDVEGAFITKSPRSLYKLGQVASIPFIFSMTSKELELGLGMKTVINISNLIYALRIACLKMFK